MTGTSGSGWPGSPPGNTGPTGPPPGYPPPGYPPPYGAPPYGAPGSPSQQWQIPVDPMAQYAGGAQKTNGLAITSLIAGILQFMCLPFIAGIVAIITGHLARGQIKRSEGREGGRGMATAGLILGYVGVVLTVLAVVGFIVGYAVWGDDIQRASLRSDAHEFAREIDLVAIRGNESPRNANVIRTAYVDPEVDVYGDATLPDGTRLEVATNADWQRNDWNVQLFRESPDAYVCLVIQPQAGTPEIVRNGHCDVVAGT